MLASITSGIEVELWWLVAAAGVGLCGVARRLLARTPGAGFGVLVVAALAAAWSWPNAETLTPAAPGRAEWQPVETGTGSARLSPPSWMELQAQVLAARRPGGLVIERRGGERLWVERSWELGDPGGLARAPNEEGAPSEAVDRSATVCPALRHPARAVAGRAAAMHLLWPGGAVPAPGRLILEAEEVGGANGPQVLATRDLAIGASELRLDVARMPELAGTYRLRARLETPAGEAGAEVLSLIDVRPAPRVAVIGEGCEALAAGMALFGFRVERVSVRPRSWEAYDLLLVGRGGGEGLDLVEYVEAGGGLWVGGPQAWEELQAGPLGAVLPAEILPEEQPEEGEGPDPGGAEPPDPGPPDESEERTPEPVDVGDMGLLILLDYSGSFYKQLATAWDLVETALKESESFTHVGVIGFNAEVFTVLELQAHGAELGAKLLRARQDLRRNVQRGGSRTLLEPALRSAHEKLCAREFAVRLVIVISDGHFNDREEAHWKNFANDQLVLESGASIATIQVLGGIMPGVEEATGNMRFLAEVGGSKALRRGDVAGAVRIVPQVAREVAERSRADSGTGRDPEKPPESQPEEPAKEPEPERREPAAPLIPRPTGLHPGEGFGAELSGEPWPALAALRAMRLRPGAAIAWIAGEGDQPLFATGIHGRGKIALQAAVIDAVSWPGGLADGRFALFATRIGDYLMRLAEPVAEARLRVLEGAVRDGAGRLGNLSGGPLQALGPADDAGPAGGRLSGTWIRSPEDGVFSTLRLGAAPASLEGERPLAEVWGQIPAAQDPARAPLQERRFLDPRRIGWLLGGGIALELLLSALVARFLAFRRFTG